MVSHAMGERVSKLGGRARERWSASRLERLDRENARLKAEIGVLRQDLEEDRSALHEALSALGDGGQRVTVEQRNGRGRILRTLLVAVGGYVLGTRDGRARFEQMKGWARSATEPIRSRVGGVSPEAAPWEPSVPASVSEADTKIRG
jgi:hypothetical protein